MVKNLAAASEELVRTVVGSEPDRNRNKLSEGAKFELIRGVEVEITDDVPTEGERKAVEGFFDWLFAEALCSVTQINSLVEGE